MSDLSELFARDPLRLTNEDVAAIIKRMREAQAQFELGLKSPIAERPKRAPKAPKVDLLKDLGLSLTTPKGNGGSEGAGNSEGEDLLGKLGLK